ncbi:MAG TPA: hypothetical protein VGN04_06450 [Herbaspirillum sp.]|jgi:hypothetical protein
MFIALDITTSFDDRNLHASFVLKGRCKMKLAQAAAPCLLHFATTFYPWFLLFFVATAVISAAVILHGCICFVIRTRLFLLFTADNYARRHDSTFTACESYCLFRF